MSENPFTESLNTGTNTGADEAAQQAAEAAAGEDEEEMSQLNIRIPKGLHKAFKQKCEAEGRNMTWVVLRAIREYVRKDT